MSLNIRLKHSAQANKQPQDSDLTPGELALNINNASPAGYALDDAGAVQQMFGKATETQEGQAEIATQPEVDAGTDDERIVTPKKLGQRLTDYTTNTVDAAIAVETAARTTAITAEANARTTADTAEANARAAAITAEENARIAGDQTNATAINTKVSKAGDTMTGDLAIKSGSGAGSVDTILLEASDGSVSFAQDRNQINGDGSISVYNAGNISAISGYNTAVSTSAARFSLSCDGSALFAGSTGTSALPGFYISTGASTYITAENDKCLALNRRGVVSEVGVIELSASGTFVGQITVDTGNAYFRNISDYRLKENVKPIADSWDRVKSLKPSKYNFIKTPDRTVEGFLAHEAQAVVPQAVSGEKDGDEMQMIDQSYLIPVLTAALKEAMERIEALETKS